MSVTQLPWRLLEAPPDRAHVVIAFDVHDYLTLERIVVEEDTQQVSLTLYGRLTAPDGGWTAYTRTQHESVALARPLGQRRLKGPHRR